MDEKNAVTADVEAVRRFIELHSHSTRGNSSQSFLITVIAAEDAEQIRLRQQNGVWVILTVDDAAEQIIGRNVELLLPELELLLLRLLFLSLLFLFIRFLPMISIFEMRTLVPEAQRLGKEPVPDEEERG